MRLLLNKKLLILKLKEKENEEFAKMVIEDRHRFWNESKQTYVLAELMRAFSISREKANHIVGKAIELEREGQSANIINNNKGYYLGDLRVK